jgi:hypothetical protein
MTHLDTMKQALEALENAQHFIDEYAAAKYIHFHNAAITSLRQAIAEAAKQEPVAYQATQEKCRIETVPAQGGLLPTMQEGKDFTITHPQPKAEPIDLEPPLEALVNLCNNSSLYCNADEVIAAEAALERLYQSRATLPAAQTAQPKAEKEPVADRFQLYNHIVLKLAEAGCKLSEQQKMVLCNLKEVTHPQPKREPLTEREILDFWLDRFDVEGSPINNFARAIEAAHGIIKNYPEKDKT